MDSSGSNQQQQRGVQSSEVPFFDLLPQGISTANFNSTPKRMENSSADFKCGGDDVLPSFDFQPIRTSAATVNTSSSSPSGGRIELNRGRQGSPPSSYTTAEPMVRRSREPPPTYETPVSRPQEHEKESFDSATAAAVELTMKKYADNLLRVLEGMTSRLSQLESTTQHLENLFEDMKILVADSHGEADGKLRSLETHILEVHRGVQVLRDRQEIFEAQSQLAKLQKTSKAESASLQKSISVPSLNVEPPAQLVNSSSRVALLEAPQQHMAIDPPSPSYYQPRLQLQHMPSLPEPLPPPQQPQQQHQQQIPQQHVPQLQAPQQQVPQQQVPQQQVPQQQVSQHLAPEQQVPQQVPHQQVPQQQVPQQQVPQQQVPQQQIPQQQVPKQQIPQQHVPQPQVLQQHVPQQQVLQQQVPQQQVPQQHLVQQQHLQQPQQLQQPGIPQNDVSQLHQQQPAPPSPQQLPHPSQHQPAYSPQQQQLMPLYSQQQQPAQLSTMASYGHPIESPQYSQHPQGPHQGPHHVSVPPTSYPSDGSSYHASYESSRPGLPPQQPTQMPPGPQQQPHNIGTYEPSMGRSGSGQLSRPGPYLAQGHPSSSSSHYESQGLNPGSGYPGSSYRVAQPVPSAPSGGSSGYPRIQLAQPLPHAVPTGAGGPGQPTSGAPLLSSNRVRIDEVIDKVSAMGFSKDQVRAAVHRLTENNQAVDLNIVLDKLMNGESAQTPPKGWFGR